jgi:hypothetical protein
LCDATSDREAQLPHRLVLRPKSRMDMGSESEAGYAKSCSGI